MKEMDILRLIMVALSEKGCVVWRNNVGVLKNAAGIPIKFGLCVGSSDVIGISPDGRFLAVEVKTDKGKPSPDQIRFIEAIKRKGGIAGIARSASDAVALLSQSAD
jgi:hypothetical protein